MFYKNDLEKAMFNYRLSVYPEEEGLTYEELVDRLPTTFSRTGLWVLSNDFVTSQAVVDELYAECEKTVKMAFSKDNRLEDYILSGELPEMVYVVKSNSEMNNHFPSSMKKLFDDLDIRQYDALDELKTSLYQKEL